MTSKTKTPATAEQLLTMLLPPHQIGRMLAEEDYVVQQALTHMLPKLPVRVTDINDPQMLGKHVIGITGEELHLINEFRKLRAAQKEVTRMINTTYAL